MTTRTKQIVRVLGTVTVAGACFLAAAASTGCRPDFAPYNRLTALRVLGIQSEPPSPATGETTTLSALVFTPTDDPTLTYSWSWCPFPGSAGEGYRCRVTEEEIIAMFPEQAANLPPFQLGTGATAQLPNTIDPGILAALCAGVPGAPPAANCTGGFPVQVALTVRTDTDQVDAVVTTRWRFDPAIPANTNPTIAALTATLPEAEPQEIGEQPSLTLRRDASTSIAAVMPLEAAESYAGLDDDGNPAMLTERIFLTWFVETGGTEFSRTSYFDGRTPFEDLLKNSWAPALKKDYEPDVARLYVVAHDSRGGVSWKGGIVNLEPTP